MSNCSPTLSFLSGAEKRPTVGSLVEAPVIGCAGTFRVIECPHSDHKTDPRFVWLRETGMHICKGYEPFVIEWPINDIQVVEQA